MPWADRVDAILVAGLPGQEGGHARGRGAARRARTQPADWSAAGRSSTAPHPHGRSPRRTACSAIPRVPSSATEDMRPDWHRRPVLVRRRARLRQLGVLRRPASGAADAPVVTVRYVIPPLGRPGRSSKCTLPPPNRTSRSGWWAGPPSKSRQAEPPRSRSNVTPGCGGGGMPPSAGGPGSTAGNSWSLAVSETSDGVCLSRARPQGRLGAH